MSLSLEKGTKPRWETPDLARALPALTLHGQRDGCHAQAPLLVSAARDQLE